MKKLFNFFFIILTGCLCVGLTHSESKSSLVIKLDNIRNNEGVFYIFIYNYENQYPYDPENHYKISKSQVKNGKLNINIIDIHGDKNKYAVTLIDDENNNADLDRFLGIPTEGYGFSNNVQPMFQLPNYDDLLFSCPENRSINIELQYFL